MIIEHLEHELIAGCQAGDIVARTKLLEIYSTRISKGIAIQYQSTKLPSEIEINDLIQEGLISFLDSVNKVKIEDLNTTSLFNFCMKKVHWHILSYLKIERRKLNRYESGVKSVDIMVENDPDDVLIIKTLDKLLANFSKRDQLICVELILTGDIDENSLYQHGISMHHSKVIFRRFKSLLKENL